MTELMSQCLEIGALYLLFCSLLMGFFSLQTTLLILLPATMNPGRKNKNAPSKLVFREALDKA